MKVETNDFPIHFLDFSLEYRAAIMLNLFLDNNLADCRISGKTD